MRKTIKWTIFFLWILLSSLMTPAYSNSGSSERHESGGATAVFGLVTVIYPACYIVSPLKTTLLWPLDIVIEGEAYAGYRTELTERSLSCFAWANFPPSDGRAVIEVLDSVHLKVAGHRRGNGWIRTPDIPVDAVVRLGGVRPISEASPSEVECLRSSIVQHIRDLTSDEAIGLTDIGDAYLVYLRVEGVGWGIHTINEQLLVAGLLEVDTSMTFAAKDEFFDLETQAKNDAQGYWGGRCKDL